jgi:hypothetical protein
MMTWTWLTVPIALTAAIAVTAPNRGSNLGPPHVQFSECQGCVKQADHDGNGTTYEIVQGLTIGNGQCNGLLPNCTSSPCNYGGILQLKNISGAPFWVDTDGDGVGTRVYVPDQDTTVIGFGDETLACGSEVQITIYADSSGGNPIARYKWICTRCPQ